jgi:Fe-S oxidoreductase
MDDLADFEDRALDAIFNCQTCGSCDVSCKITRFNLEPLAHNIALKERAVALGKATPEMTAVIDLLGREQTMLPGRTRADRTKWAEGLGLKDLTKESAEYAFFPGCQYAYDETLQKKARTYAEILQRAGVDLGYMGKADLCCGGRAKQMGFKDAFEKEAGINLKALEGAGVKTIVTPCSDCYHAFKRLYATWNPDIKVIHTAELIADLIANGTLKPSKRVDLTVTYHDPCRLGRLGEPFVPWEGKEKKVLNQIHTWDPPRPRYAGTYGVYDAPRSILTAIPGVKLIEMERIREYAWCCGAGGGCSISNPAYAAATATERVTEARATGADAIVTACPWCEKNLGGSPDEDGNPMETIDILDLLARAL